MSLKFNKMTLPLLFSALLMALSPTLTQAEETYGTGDIASNQAAAQKAAIAKRAEKKRKAAEAKKQAEAQTQGGTESQTGTEAPKEKAAE